jgi:hypothetical protein
VVHRRIAEPFKTSYRHLPPSSSPQRIPLSEFISIQMRSVHKRYSSEKEKQVLYSHARELAHRMLEISPVYHNSVHLNVERNFTVLNMTGLEKWVNAKHVVVAPDDKPLGPPTKYTDELTV